MKHLTILLLLFSHPVLAAPIHLSDKLFIQDLGPGVKPTAINNNGQVVGQDASGQAFLWENGTITTLGTLGGIESYANDINDNGVVVGWSLDSEGRQKSFRYGWQGKGIENLDATVSFEGAAEGINNEGRIVGWRTNGSFISSVQWHPANATINTGEFLFGEFNHKLLDINEKGEAVGITITEDHNPDDGFFWSGQDTTLITGSMGSNYFPYAGINNFGLSAGLQDGAEYFRLGDVLSTNIPAETPSEALGLNDLDWIVGKSGANGFIYDLSSLTFYNINDFDRTGKHLDSILSITDINENGQFVGWAMVNGANHGVSGNIHVVPEPSTLSMLTLGLSDLIIWIFSRDDDENNQEEKSTSTEIQAQ